MNAPGSINQCADKLSRELWIGAKNSRLPSGSGFSTFLAPSLCCNFSNFVLFEQRLKLTIGYCGPKQPIAFRRFSALTQVKTAALSASGDHRTSSSEGSPSDAMVGISHVPAIQLGGVELPTNAPRERSSNARAA